MIYSIFLSSFFLHQFPTKICAHFSCLKTSVKNLKLRDCVENSVSMRSITFLSRITHSGDQCKVAMLWHHSLNVRRPVLVDMWLPGVEISAPSMQTEFLFVRIRNSRESSWIVIGVCCVHLPLVNNCWWCWCWCDWM